MLNADSDLCDDFDVDCDTVGKGAIILGAAVAGTGVALWVVGKSKAPPASSPLIVATPHGVTVRSRIHF